MPSSSSTTTTATPYKGKITHRSWQQLPPEIIRLIATNYLLDVFAAGFCPQTWQPRELWPSRMVYTVIRDALELEKLMWLCPSWMLALETHLFWHQACAAIDPYDFLASHAIITPSNTGSTAAALIHLTPYRHFRNITQSSCIVCRVNAPHLNTGLATCKRVFSTYLLSNIAACRDHRKASFCGLCLREAPQVSDYQHVTCVENEDEETWPGVDATCRVCRGEWLWRRVANNPRDREAVGGPKFASADWETRQTIDAFVEVGEGTISEVVNLAQEKLWLRQNTKLPDMLSQAVAASRYASREEGYESEDELSDTDEEDPELMSLTEDAGGVRDLALNDWARNRILDGLWISPADQWYGYTMPNYPIAVPAVHPCPWNLSPQDPEGTIHPTSATVRSEVPPSYQLCEQVFRAFQKQMRLILLPAMQNIVRKFVIECTADGVDPAIKVARMDMEDVAQELRDEGVWYNGIDWLLRRANSEKEREEKARRVDQSRRTKEEDDSSSSSKSDGSHTTSPVLSTTTLQTTPSPPPSVTSKKRLNQNAPPAIPIPVLPVLAAPVLLHPIPYIPSTTAHMPYYSSEAFKLVWREACSPLYQCRCGICERAMLNANIAAGNIVPTQPTSASFLSDEAISSREIVYDGTPAELVVPDVPVRETVKDSSRSPSVPRKRPSTELDTDHISDREGYVPSECGGATKKMRRDNESVICELDTPSPEPSPTRLKKRSSEELDDEDDKLTAKKRVRLDDSDSSDVSPPLSTSRDIEDSDYSVEEPSLSTAPVYNDTKVTTHEPHVVIGEDSDGLYLYDSSDIDADGELNWGTVGSR